VPGHPWSELRLHRVIFLIASPFPVRPPYRLVRPSIASMWSPGPAVLSRPGTWPLRADCWDIGQSRPRPFKPISLIKPGSPPGFLLSPKPLSPLHRGRCRGARKGCPRGEVHSWSAMDRCGSCRGVVCVAARLVQADILRVRLRCLRMRLRYPNGIQLALTGSRSSLLLFRVRR
jgi:hypothetical protein